MILAIDPGPKESGFVLYDHEGKHPVVQSGKYDNERILSVFQGQRVPVVVEMIEGRGMPVGQDVFETCVWIGRYTEVFDVVGRLFRREVKLHLCGSARAKDANVRQALIDKFPSTGGGRKPQIGTKKEPGPLYGISGDAWAALGVAVTWKETR